MIIVSVVIPTFNSARTLPLVLSSIRKQTYPQKYIEVLVIDGGSTDKTCEIAKTYDARVIRNPKVEPLYARYLGYLQSRGDYLMYIDHDEVLMNDNSIKDRVHMFKKNPDIKAVTGNGYRSPTGYGFINKYINEFGDPFSFFIYRLSKHADYFVDDMRHRYTLLKESSTYAIFDLASANTIPIIEIVAGGGMIDAVYYKKNFPKITTSYHLLPHLLLMLGKRYPYIAIMKHDELLHFSSDNFKSYMTKIIWRIKNNIFFTNTIGASGFSGRQEYEMHASQWKKYLFIPYALTILFPVIDGLHLSVTRKDVSYMLHVPLTIITSVIIVYFLLRKAFGLRPRLMSYDGTIQAYEKN